MDSGDRLITERLHVLRTLSPVHCKRTGQFANLLYAGANSASYPYDDDDDCRFVKRITQDASTALRVPVRCEEVSFQR